MIATITLNAAIDKTYNVQLININEVNRVSKATYGAGGKGINCTKVIRALGEEVTAAGLIGGFNGEFILKELRDIKVKTSFTSILGETRICIAIKDGRDNYTEFLEPGPEVSKEEYYSFLKGLEQLINYCDILTLSGSLPHGVPIEAYKEIITMAKKRGIKCLLDSSGSSLIQGIEGAPYFIKPNEDEICQLMGCKVRSFEQLKSAIKELLSRGIEIVTVTLGSKGSITGYKDKFYQVELPPIEVINPVGSGDAFTAGMAVALRREMSIEEAIKFASACGTANALEEKTGYVEESKVKELMKSIKVNSFELYI